MPDPRPAHSLGPHVVGTRVVVRRRVPGETGPSGGPALTDVLGTCLRWSDGECVVQPEDGPAVTIALRDVVAGKPVPPRPSVHARVTPMDVHRHVASLWAGVEVEHLGEWVLRAAPPVDGRPRRRANSALAMGDPGVPLPDALERVRAFAARHDREPLAVVEEGSPRQAELAALGWQPIPLAAVQTRLASVAQVRRRLGRPASEATFVVDDQRVEVRLGPDGPDGPHGAARGRAAVEGDWVGLHGVLVHPDHRRQGLAAQVVATLLAWGAERGARTAWLHVEGDNDPAVALWASLGFLTHHEHRYVGPDQERTATAPGRAAGS